MTDAGSRIFERDLEERFAETLLDSGCSQVRYSSDGSAEGRFFNLSTMLDEQAFGRFIRESQPLVHRGLVAVHQDRWLDECVDAFNRSVNKHGLVHTLLHGYSVYSFNLHAVFFKPEDPSNTELAERYACNRVEFARQFRFSKRHPNDSIDIVILLNGIPVVAVEVKNLLTGQSVTDAEEQYRNRDRDEPVFRPDRRILACFAVDNYEASVSTRIVGEGTVFKPYNRDPGASSCRPRPEYGIETLFLFREVLGREPLLRIIGSYVTRMGGESGPWVMFPRHHQLDCVDCLVSLALEEGPGHNYLVQHSAGSGKTNTILWLAARLQSLFRNGLPMYDAVVVVVHRLVLDDQLDAASRCLSRVDGSVVHVESVAELTEALQNGSKIIITTIQKFSRVRPGLRTDGSNFAIIVDEAHTHSTGKMARDAGATVGVSAPDRARLDAVRGVMPDAEEDDESLYAMIAAEGPQDNLSYFAFTATPTSEAFVAFGRELPSGAFAPHHVYSMCTAIREGYICNVVADYMSFDEFYDVRMADLARRDDLVDVRRVRASALEALRGNSAVIADKAAFIVDNFLETASADLGGRAKGMVVVERREYVLEYKRAIEAECRKRGVSSIRVMAAFSGFLDDGGRRITEDSLNKMPDGSPVRSAEMAKAFSGPAFNLMVAADKFQVGFDEPYLDVMYVDKPLSGVNAVQTLSRLNRVVPGMYKQPHVIDFCNDPEDIREAFSFYYEETVSAEGYDPRAVYATLEDILDYGVFSQEDADEFSRIDLAGKDALAQCGGLFRPAIERFTALGPEGRVSFRRQSKSFVNLYAVGSFRYRYGDPKLRRCVDYLGCLLDMLPRRDGDPPVPTDVVLVHHRLVPREKADLTPEDGQVREVPVPKGASAAPPLTPMEVFEEAVRRINADNGLPDFTDADMVVLEDASWDVVEYAVEQKRCPFAEIAEWAPEDFDLEFFPKAKALYVKRATKNESLRARMVEHPDSVNGVVRAMLRYIHDDPKFRSPSQPT